MFISTYTGSKFISNSLKALNGNKDSEMCLVYSVTSYYWNSGDSIYLGLIVNIGSAILVGPVEGLYSDYILFIINNM